MNIDKQEIKALALACTPARCADQAEEARRLAEFYSELTPEVVLALLTENDTLKAAAMGIRDTWREDQAELEAFRSAMHKVMEQVDGNIRETVRDCVNGRDDVQDIYGYCDTIEEIIDAAMAKEASQ